MSTFKKSVISGIVWAGGGQMTSLVVVLITNIFLARLLNPEEFGQLGIIMFFIVVANIFSQGGLAGAVVRKKEPQPQDFSTVFVFNFVVSLVLFLILSASSGWIADYYDDSELQNLLIAASSILVISSFQYVQNLRMVIEMRFNRKAILTFVSNVIGSGLAIALAYNGFGVWSLVALPIITNLSLTFLLWWFEGFYFNLNFDKTSFFSLYKFGINTTLVSMLNTAFDNIYQLVLGKTFSIAHVGLFYQAKKLQDVPSNMINVISQGVIFSALAKVQDDSKLFLQSYNKLVLYFTVVMGFTTMMIYSYAENIILLLYGKQWIGAVFFMELLCIASFFYLQELINKVIFKVYDATRRLLILEIVKKLIQVVSIAIGVIMKDLEILIIGFVITNAISYFINYYYSRKVLGKVSYYELKILLMVFLTVILMILLIGGAGELLPLDGHWNLIFAPLAAVIYFVILKIFKVFNIFKEYASIKKLFLKK